MMVPDAAVTLPFWSILLAVRDARGGRPVSTPPNTSTEISTPINTKNSVSGVLSGVTSTTTEWAITGETVGTGVNIVPGPLVPEVAAKSETLRTSSLPLPITSTAP